MSTMDFRWIIALSIYTVLIGPVLQFSRAKPPLESQGKGTVLVRSR